MAVLITIQLEKTPELIRSIDRYCIGSCPAALLHDAKTGETWGDLTVNLPEPIAPNPETDGFVPTAKGHHLDVFADSRYAKVIRECRYGNIGQIAYVVRFEDELLTATEAV